MYSSESRLGCGPIAVASLDLGDDLERDVGQRPGDLHRAVRPATDGEDAQVHALLDAPSLKRVFIGGKFTRIDAVSRTDLASVGQKLGTLRTWASAPLGQVWSLALGGSSALYAAVGGHQGGQLDSFDPGSGALRWNRFADGDVQAVSTSGNIVFAGGHFLNACATNQGGGNPWVCTQPVARNRFFATDLSGALLPWDPEGNSLYGVWALRSDVGHIVAGGDFTIVDAVHQARFAEFLR